MESGQLIMCLILIISFKIADILGEKSLANHRKRLFNNFFLNREQLYHSNWKNPNLPDKSPPKLKNCWNNLKEIRLLCC